MTSRKHPKPLSLRTARPLAAALAATAAAAVLAAGLPVGLPVAPATAGPGHQHPGEAVSPLVIGHRGASGHRPEHTLAAYRLAIRQGADYIEPDLVPTRDGVLVARHENEISGTTDVSRRPEFADRRTTKVIDGRTVTGWFTEDFTYAELRRLRAVERLPQVRPDNTRYDGRYRVPTLVEVVRLARSKGVGVYPETKHPSYFDSLGLSMEEPLVQTLERFGLDDADDEVVIQSFETANLRELATMTDVELAQLVDASGAPHDLVAAGDPRSYRDLVTPAGLAEIATYADGVGVHKDLVLPRDAAGATSVPSALVTDAHAEELVVHVWTLRAENQFMASNFRVGTDPVAHGDLAAETRAFIDAGVDGIFTDHPDVVVTARDSHLEELAGRRR